MRFSINLYNVAKKVILINPFSTSYKNVPYKQLPYAEESHVLMWQTIGHIVIQQALSFTNEKKNYSLMPGPQIKGMRIQGEKSQA